MKPSIFSLLLAISLCFTGCYYQQSSYADPDFIAETALTIETTTPVDAETPPDIPSVSTGSTEAPLEIPAGSHFLRFDSVDTGDYLDYYLFIPENAVAEMPLVVFLHGDGQVYDPEGLENYGPISCAREIYGENYPFILISPCTRVFSWTDGSIPATLMELINTVIDQYRIDRKHLIITGHSRGAIGVWYMISEYGDIFSAAVPVSCGADRALNSERLATVPVYAIAGDIGQDERIYSYKMEMLVSQINELGGNAEFSLLQGCSHADTDTAAYTQETFEWMLEQ